MQTETQPTGGIYSIDPDVGPDTIRCVTCGDEWPCEASEVELQAPGTSPFGTLHRPEVYDALFMTQWRSARIC